MTTKFTLDLAASVPLEVPDGPVDVRVVLPERAIEQAFEALVAGETYVVVGSRTTGSSSSSWPRRRTTSSFGDPTDARRTLEACSRRS